MLHKQIYDEASVRTNEQTKERKKERLEIGLPLIICGYQKCMFVEFLFFLIEHIGPRTHVH